MKNWLYLFAIAAALGLGYGLGSGKIKADAEKTAAKVAPEIHPEREVAPTEYKSFALVLYAHDDAPWCEKALRSVFEQDYDHYRVFFIDDGSSDGTFEKAQNYAMENGQEHRVILIKNEIPQGKTGCLYRAVEQCLDREIVIPLSARDWLAHPNVLSRWNRAFQNPDVWISFGQAVSYPEYALIHPPERKKEEIEKNGYGASFLDRPFCFYSALFKQLPLSDLFQEDSFRLEQASYLLPMLELSGGRFKSLAEPVSFQNQTLPRQAETVQNGHRYLPLSQFPSQQNQNRTADIVIFSFDRPLQLFATLESIYRYVSGFERLSVLYRTSDDRYEAAYQEIKQAFPDARFIRQGESPRKDFKPLLLEAAFRSPSKYILFGVDDIIVKEEVDLHLCMEAMEKTQAYGFFLRLGSHIKTLFSGNEPQEIPPSIPLTGGVFAWDIQKVKGDWGFANNVDLTLYRKADIRHSFESLSYKNPNSLEFNWSHHPPERAIGLYFERSKMVNIPLNVLTNTGNPHMNYLTVEELLVKFNQQLKIDIDPLYHIENASPHFEHEPTFVLR